MFYMLAPDPDGTPYIYMADPQGREENPLYYDIIQAFEIEEIAR